ncbi:hypothetical protein P175DRAFT_0503208 [Aspergillus ochraceoroseus IBT 24754]|uniref:Uncharacterized protein n=1 Tax=Aspergillus ochraceoroseus IBT 24754 TaxID=1392256 RepID=A0A2T5LTQ5_9EURO|nr:uncharacterized protein P175DRAFT_0503208 [Aspergillus ochraceoroseus IBT 24754]PTU19666.1 hypothetical protein P175DRAFT_0503208 [Aspergillus ochraceoroseus IBT 24754]
MPHLLHHHHHHHRRRYSWPYCNSGQRLRERRNLPIITIRGPPNQYASPFLTPVVSEDLLEDDVVSAGIMHSQPPRPLYRLWSSSSSSFPETSHMEYQSRAKDSSPGSGLGCGCGSLRRMTQPPLDRTRSLLVLPTTLSAGQAMISPYWIERLSAHPMPHSNGPGRLAEGDARARLAVNRNHRRCHSERPRAWKEPSENLWTLQEE